MTDKKLTIIILFVLFVACLTTYSPVLNNAFINFDDQDYLTKNVHVQSGLSPANIKWAFTSVVSANWHPLTMISHMADWSLFKDHAGGHHLISLLLHIGSVFLLFLFLKKTTGQTWPAAFAAALFALHPLRVESVAWASERKDVLSLFFGLAALYTYSYYVEKPQLSRYFFCLILFALGLMAKPMLVTLPFILLLMDYWPLARWKKEVIPERNITAEKVPRKTKPTKNKSVRENADSAVLETTAIGQLLREKIPFFILSIASSILTIWAQQKGQALVSLQVVSFPERFMNAAVSYILYVGKMIWPVNLAIFYPYQEGMPLWQLLAALIILLLVTAAVIFYIKKLPFLFVGWFWYLGTLVPVIGLVQVGRQAMADRYTYLPGIGIIIMTVWLLTYLSSDKKILRNILTAIACGILVILSVATWQQCGYWKNSITLHAHALQSTRNNDMAHYCLGSALRDQGNIEGALKNFQEAVRINPDFPDYHNDTAIILSMHYQRHDEAIHHFQQSLQLDPRNSNTHLNLAIVLANKNDVEGALRHFQTAASLDPGNEKAQLALAKFLELTGIKIK